MTDPRPDHAPSSEGPVSDAPLDEVRIDLPDGPAAPREARRAVQTVLGRWNLPALVDSVVLAVSELVTNAVRHGRPPLLVILSRGPRRLRVDVHDGVREGPVVTRDAPTVNPDAESGRGLGIVSALADDAGCDVVPGNGKTVYASFDTSRQDTGDTA